MTDRIYKLRTNEDDEVLGCIECASEVPVSKFDFSSRPAAHLCVFCANTIGAPYDGISKAMMAQMMNVLHKNLNSKIESEFLRAEILK